jgi:hypothetical protein
VRKNNRTFVLSDKSAVGFETVFQKTKTASISMPFSFKGRLKITTL